MSATLRMLPYVIVFAAATLTSAAHAQGVPSLPIPGAGTFDPGKGAPPPPTKKLPNGECVAPGHTTYSQVRNFVPFYSLEDCLKSGGRQPRPGPAMTRPPAK